MIRLYVAATLALLALQACGSARSTPTLPRPDPDGAAGSAAVGSAGHAAPTTGSAATAESPTAEECDALFAHAVAVEVAQRPPDQQLAEPELAAVRAKLREQKLPACLQLSRATYRCMLAAPTLPALTTCT